MAPRRRPGTERPPAHAPWAASLGRAWRRCRDESAAVRARVAQWRRRHSRQLAVGALAAAAAAALFGWVLVGSPWVRVQSVQVELADLPGSAGAALRAEKAATRAARVADIESAAAISLGQPLVEVDTSAVTERVESLGRYSSVNVRRSWPHAVSISVLPRVPVVAILDGSGTAHLVDASGLEFDRVAKVPAEVPQAHLARPGEAASREAAITVANALTPALGGRLGSIDVDSYGQVSVMIDRVRVDWGRPGEDKLKAAVVAALADGEGVRSIDVRAPLRPVTTDGRAPQPSS